MGHGSRPVLCCRYKPNASMATQTALTTAWTLRGVRSTTDRKTVSMNYLEASSSALQDGEHTACDFPKIFLEIICERARCLPHRKHDMVAAPNEVAAVKGEPDTFDL